LNFHRDRVRRNHGRLRSNSFIERAPRTLPAFTDSSKRASDKALTFLRPWTNRLLASGINGLLMGNSAKGVPPQMVTFTQVFWASGIFQMVKVTEIVAGFMLLFGIFPALATLFLAPDVVGIVIVNARLMPSFLWIGAVVFVLTAYLGYAYWDKYKLIFSRN
jgi:putative oxidoreductase